MNKNEWLFIGEDYSHVVFCCSQCGGIKIVDKGAPVAELDKNGLECGCGSFNTTNPQTTPIQALDILKKIWTERGYQ